MDENMDPNEQCVSRETMQNINPMEAIAPTIISICHKMNQCYVIRKWHESH